MPRAKNEVLTGVEIGTSTIKVVMGAVLPEDEIAILGAAEIPSLRVVKGEVTEAAVVQEHLERALAAAEQEAGQEIGDVFLAVTGAHIQTVNSVGSTVINAPDRKISEDDVVRAGRNAHGYTLSPDKKILHYFDRHYQIDRTREVTNPVGLVGTRLEADVHIVFGQHNRIETNCRLIADVMSYPAVDVAFSPVAAGFAVLSAEETEKGALLIDVGAGVTEYAVFHGPGCVHSGQLAVGCDQITNDLALGLRVPMPKARQILHELGNYGSAVMTPDGRARLMKVDALGRGERKIPVSTTEQIIELRLQELFENIKWDLESRGALQRAGGGAVLCGGGARIPGINRLAQHVLQMPVDTARPQQLTGRHDQVASPAFVVPLGLLRWGKMMLDISAPEPMPFWRQFQVDAKKAWGVTRRAFRW
ncbi:MAG: cell division protein FtsA [Lentisphaerae bacterium]|nr:cell division protein FtsA [Lentisphaerota bacterium]MBT5613155.1 cell division protein FtsA [Lentisphaerota bacterium]MBT7061939.1 cell division protein FtsA [Lentisphaerota bacterium]